MLALNKLRPEHVLFAVCSFGAVAPSHAGETTDLNPDIPGRIELLEVLENGLARLRVTNLPPDRAQHDEIVGCAELFRAVNYLGNKMDALENGATVTYQGGGEQALQKIIDDTSGVFESLMRNEITVDEALEQLLPLTHGLPFQDVKVHSIMRDAIESVVAGKDLREIHKAREEIGCHLVS